MINYIRLAFIVLAGVVFATLSIIFTPFNYIWEGIGPYIAYKSFARCVLFACGIKLEVERRGELQKKHKYLIISNHLSLLDIPVIMTVFRHNVRFIYKKSLSKIPIFGWAMYIGGYVPINRDNPRSAISSLQDAAKKLTERIAVAIFPEGTRSRTGVTGDFKKGVFMLAEYTQADIIPVSISGTNKIIPPDTFSIRPGVVKVVIGEPMKFTKDKSFLNDIRYVIVGNLKEIES